MATPEPKIITKWRQFIRRRNHQWVQTASRQLAAVAAVTVDEDVQPSIGQARQDGSSHAPDDGKPSACLSALRSMTLHVADL